MHRKKQKKKQKQQEKYQSDINKMARTAQFSAKRKNVIPL